MKKLQDYQIETEKRFRGLHVETLQMLPRAFLPQAILFSIATSGIVALGLKGNDVRAALVALVILALLFACVFAMTNKK